MQRLLDLLRQLRHTRVIHIETNTAGPNESAPETTATQQRSQLKEIAANPSAIGSGRQKTNIPGQCAEIPRVIGEPFQFERAPAQRLRPRAWRPIPQPFHTLTI